jgi:flagellar motor switch protein FliM
MEGPTEAEMETDTELETAAEIDDEIEAAAESEDGDDDLAGWGGDDRALDQSDIDNLFGDSPQAKTEVRRGFGALITNEVSGVERMPLLNIMIDRLAQSMTVSMRAFTGDNADVSIDRLQSCRVKEYLDAVSVPAMIAVLRIEPWEGYCLAALDARLITSAMEVLLGGRRNRGAPIEGRPYTAVERSFVERLTQEVIAKDLKFAFELIGETEFVIERFETTPSYAAITKASAAAVTFRAEVAMDHRGGYIDFLFPYSSFDPVREQLVEEFVGKKAGGDPLWRSHLSNILPHADVPLRAVIEERMISSAEVMGWKVGSRLELTHRKDEPIDILCSDVLVARAAIADKEGRIALHISERCLAADWPR